MQDRGHLKGHRGRGRADELRRVARSAHRGGALAAPTGLRQPIPPVSNAPLPRLDCFLSATRLPRLLRRWPNRAHPLGRVALGPADTLRRKGLYDTGAAEYALPAASTGATAGALRYKRRSNHVAVGVDAAKSFPFDGEQAEAAAVSVRGHSSTAGKCWISKARRDRNAPALPLGRRGHG